MGIKRVRSFYTCVETFKHISILQSFRTFKKPCMIQENLNVINDCLTGSGHVITM
jgi:hypothetical protein